MIDIHAHVIPGIDDGASSMEEAVEMCMEAYHSGVDQLVAVCHCLPGNFGIDLCKQYIHLFSDLKDTLLRRGCGLRLLPGMEVLFTPSMLDALKSNHILSINRTKYVLVEVDFDADPEDITLGLECLLRAGFRPVLAHPERYECVMDDPFLLRRWRSMRVTIQGNKGSVLGRFGEKQQETIDLLIRHNLIDCLASDAHHVHFRNSNMEPLADFCIDHYGPMHTRLLLEENPKRIINGQSILIPKQ